MSDEQPKVVPIRIGRPAPADKAVTGFKWVLFTPKPRPQDQPSKVEGIDERDE